MSKSLRLSEKWFNRGLWLVALAFGGFLAGLGGLVVADLPRVERPLRLEDYIDHAAAVPLRAAAEAAQRVEDDADGSREQAALRLRVAQQAYANRRDTFTNWLETRKATQLPAQDSELIARTQALDTFKAAENDARRLVDAQDQVRLDARQAQNLAQRKLGALEEAASARLDAAASRAELRVFLYRLALMLPLLAVAGWLFAKRRRSMWWPFVWGFIFFALYGFFVELVPYLPSYGGYVRFIVGLIVTALIGRAVIVALHRCLARPRLAEQQPDQVRRSALSYDTALARLAKSACPGCERKVDLTNLANDFCPHCGIALFESCGNCKSRRGAFAQFCHACGVPAAILAP